MKSFVIDEHSESAERLSRLGLGKNIVARTTGAVGLNFGIKNSNPPVPKFKTKLPFDR